MIPIKTLKVYLSISRNITERKKALQAIQESEIKYKTIFSFAPVGIYQSTYEGKIITANNRFIQMLGFKNLEELSNYKMYDFYLSQKERVKLIKKYVEGGSVVDLELKWKSKDGKVLIVQLSSQAVKDKDGKVQWFEGFVRDVTERKKAESALFESEKRYRELF